MQNLSLYHQVETMLWLEVRKLIQSLAVQRMSSKTDNLKVLISKEQVSIIVNFCNQMEFAHLHPNSSARKFKLAISDGKIIEEKITKISQQSKKMRKISLRPVNL